MWKELQEIRVPVQTTAKWLEYHNAKVFQEDLRFGQKKDSGAPPPSPEEIRREFDLLTLQDFLSLLQPVI